MFDENVCFTCGENAPGNSYYIFTLFYNFSFDSFLHVLTSAAPPVHLTAFYFLFFAPSITHFVAITDPPFDLESTTGRKSRFYRTYTHVIAPPPLANCDPGSCGIASYSLYCSEKCRLLDSGDGSTSTSNSSVAPSSASSSPSRTSPRVGAAKHRKDRSRAHAGFPNWTSRTSSRTSSPSVQSSDLPDFSDYDLDVVGGDFKTGGDSLDLRQSHSTLKNEQKFMDHAFWSSRYGDFGVATPPGGRNQEGPLGSKSMPGVTKTLEYVRKPGPINAIAQISSSKSSAGYSPHSISHGYKRYSSDYAYPLSPARVHDAAIRDKKLSRKDSGESATSSTPRSKAAVALSPSWAQPQATVSDSVLTATQPPLSSTTGTMRHVSDSMVHTIRRAIQPFTSTKPLETASVSGADRRDSAALTNLKDVARSHGMVVSDGSKSHSRWLEASSMQQPRTHVGPYNAPVDSNPVSDVTSPNRGQLNTIQESFESTESPVGGSSLRFSLPGVGIGTLSLRTGSSGSLEEGFMGSESSQTLPGISSSIPQSSRIRPYAAVGPTWTPLPRASTEPPHKRRRTDNFRGSIPPFDSENHIQDPSGHQSVGSGQAAEAMRLTQTDEGAEPPSTTQSMQDVINELNPTMGSEPYSSSSPTRIMTSADDQIVAVKNVHAKGLSNGSTNGSVTNGSLSPRVEFHSEHNTKRTSTINRVNPSGTTLYPGSATDREQFVRLVLQALKDIGYLESASTLEAESGFSFETSRVAAFRSAVLDGNWALAQKALLALGVRDEDSLRAACFLINQQKYLEYLENNQSTEALLTLRQEIAPLDIEPARLNYLSSLIMSSNPDDLRRRASWDGAKGNSRRILLDRLQQFVPSSTMVPPRRLDTLLEQAREYQQGMCEYHMSSHDASLYHDHICSRSQFPTTTTHILEGHTDEVWQIQWNHRGDRLASSSKDQTVIIWKLAHVSNSNDPDWTLEKVLRGHTYPLNAISWSPDDKLLLSSGEHEVKLWDVESGKCIRTLSEHHHLVNGLCWLPNGDGFITGGMDRKVVHWDAAGEAILLWPLVDIRISGLAMTPNGQQLLAIGLLAHPMTNVDDSGTSIVNQATILQASAGVQPSPEPRSNNGNSADMERRVVLYDIATRQELWSQAVWGELQSVKISDDSRFALINHSQGDVMLWDLLSGCLAQRYLGRPKGTSYVRSCFGGADNHFILSGSDDGRVYIWNRRTSTLFEILSGHESGVNSVDWCPRENATFASCGDDGTIRIWGPEPNGFFIDASPMFSQDASNGNVHNGKVTGTLTSLERHLTPPPTTAKDSPLR
ncbi:hypothetical protein FRC17_003841 [Serendipita sp. 399]|nr:hypothetical protein FRC17_003841 [Serendipita sp. 399]